MDRTCIVCGGATWGERFRQVDRTWGVPGEWTVIECEGCGLVSYEPLPQPAAIGGMYPAQYYAHGGDAPPSCGGARERLRGLIDDLHLGVRRGPKPAEWALRALLWPALWYKEVYSYARYLRDVPWSAEGPPERPRVLDVGCGDGAFLVKAARLGFEPHGLDPLRGSAPAALEAAGITFHRGELAAHRPPEGRGYDVITLNHVIEHVLDPGAMLGHVRRLLGPGGRVLIRTPRTDYLLFRRWATWCYNLDVPRHVYLFTPDNLARLAGAHGLCELGRIAECQPTSLQESVRLRLYGAAGKPDGAARGVNVTGRGRWLAHPAISAALLPLNLIQRLTGQADFMAMWFEAA